MKFRIFSFFASFFLLASLFAQLPSANRSASRAQNRAENKVNNKVDRTVDEAVDEVFNGLFGKKKKTTESPASSSDSSTAQSADSPSQKPSGDWEAYVNERPFSFTVEYTMTKKNGKEDRVVMHFATIEDAFAMSIEDEKGGTNMRLILDTETGKTTTVTTNKKGESSAIRMKLPSFGNMASNKMEETASQNITIDRTGERKTIDGYDCEKVIITDHDEGNVTTNWITQDIDLTWQEMLSAMTGFGGGASKKMPNFDNMANEVGGLVIQGTMVTKKETIEYHYKNIKLDGNTDRSYFNLDGIEVMDIGF
jgi:hypothetical protein